LTGRGRATGFGVPRTGEKTRRLIADVLNTQMTIAERAREYLQYRTDGGRPMASDTTLVPARTAGSAEPLIEPEILTLRTQLVNAGHTKDLLASTDNVTFHIHCYGPKAGENGLHAPTHGNRIFVV